MWSGSASKSLELLAPPFLSGEKVAQEISNPSLSVVVAVGRPDKSRQSLAMIRMVLARSVSTFIVNITSLYAP